jgi:hypothetical protein
MFSVVVQGYGAGSQRRAERQIKVAFPRLQALMQSIALMGGRILEVIPAEADDQTLTSAVAVAPTPAPAP